MLFISGLDLAPNFFEFDRLLAYDCIHPVDSSSRCLSNHGIITINLSSYSLPKRDHRKLSRSDPRRGFIPRPPYPPTRWTTLFFGFCRSSTYPEHHHHPRCRFFHPMSPELFLPPFSRKLNPWRDHPLSSNQTVYIRRACHGILCQHHRPHRRNCPHSTKRNGEHEREVESHRGDHGVVGWHRGNDERPCGVENVEKAEKAGKAEGCEDSAGADGVRT